REGGPRRPRPAPDRAESGQGLDLSPLDPRVARGCADAELPDVAEPVVGRGRRPRRRRARPGAELPAGLAGAPPHAPATSADGRAGEERERAAHRRRYPVELRPADVPAAAGLGDPWRPAARARGGRRLLRLLPAGRRAAL